MKRFVCFCLISILCIIGLIPTATGFANSFSVKKEAVLCALYEADIATLREAIDLGIVSCEELTNYYLERISAYNHKYNCFITICEDAVDVARQRDKELANGSAKGILFGIPVVIKDNIDLAGYHTTNGHKKTDEQIASDNAQIVDYLLAEGAVIIAKANMSTDAQSARDSISKAAGQTFNAYSTNLSPAGSSGGSAVSTSLNFTAAALGTDTNSSLRLPAAYAGCVSLRGTFGLVSTDGVTALNKTRDIPGAITRTVYDQAIMLDALTGGEYKYTENLSENALQGLRIGVLKELCYPVSNNSERTENDIDPEISAAFSAALEELKSAGVELVEVSMPNIFSLYKKTTNSNLASYKEALYAAFNGMLDAYNVSAVVFPTYLSTPLRTGTDSDGKYWNVWQQTFINNCSILSPSAGIPEITVPIGMHSLGCGIGIEIAAPKNHEQQLLDIAYSYTQSYDHREVPSGAPNTYVSFSEGTLSQIIEQYKNASQPQTTVSTLAETSALPTTTPTVTDEATEAITTTRSPTSTAVPITTPVTTQHTVTTTTPATSASVASDEPDKGYTVYVLGVILAALILLLVLICIKMTKNKDK